MIASIRPEAGIVSVIASEAKQSRVTKKDWIASSLTLLAMTAAEAYSNPAPLAHLYFAPSTATGISVV